MFIATILCLEYLFPIKISEDFRFVTVVTEMY